mgnify:CR=1 FL=1
MNHAAIRTALDTKLAALGAITVAWPGVPFTPPASGVWYKPAILPGGVDVAGGVGGSVHQNGDFQVSVFAPAGTGTTALHAAADALVAHFDRVLLASGFLHCGVPEIGPLLQEADWLQLPVTVPYTVL